MNTDWVPPNQPTTHSSLTDPYFFISNEFSLFFGFSLQLALKEALFYYDYGLLSDVSPLPAANRALVAFVAANVVLVLPTLSTGVVFHFPRMEVASILFLLKSSRKNEKILK